ncbi:hypothetical protein [Streptomyces sp. NBC_01361]|uniref:hypothetical protein n=1 Tax=Streptomyces sp. NBC_01361 TaxID=2903838 RepID=UPI002E37D5A7|nr:hypothetical protein [Streptomyces sp. NBC_01361]
MTDRRTRFTDWTTERLQLSAMALSNLARSYEQTGPKTAEEQIHSTLNEVLDELALRRTEFRAADQAATRKEK